MAIINGLRFVDTLRERLGDQVSRQFTDALQDEMAPLMTKEEIHMLISGLVDQFEAQMWRVIAIATGLQLTALALATTLILTLD